ncbi:MAG: ABC transporter ATP-binding protein [Nitrososphaerota archaeon]|nr:ABC transporter ATP-binding protein [Candidatus Geocrenenecus dongiae]
MKTTSLRLVNISKLYGKIVALQDINLEVHRGELLTILGPSGSGKSTLLKIIGGFEEPTSGEVWINDKLMNGVPPYKRPTSMVFQDLALFPHLNVFDNISYGLKIRKMPINEIKKKVRSIAELLHIEDILDRRITQLSGGQAQRVALARSLVIEPEILLLDEPLGPLDLKLRREMQLELRKIQKNLNATWIYVTHDHEEAMVMSDRIAVLKAGRILEVGDVKQIYEKPKNKFVAEFFGETNFFECRIEKIENGIATASCNEIIIQFNAFRDMKPGDEVTLMIRPEKIKLLKNSPTVNVNVAEGYLREVVYKGPHLDIKIELKNSKTMFVRSIELPYRIGEHVYLTWRDEDVAVIIE